MGTMACVECNMVKDKDALSCFGRKITDIIGLAADIDETVGMFVAGSSQGPAIRRAAMLNLAAKYPVCSGTIFRHAEDDTQLPSNFDYMCDKCGGWMSKKARDTGICAEDYFGTYHSLYLQLCENNDKWMDREHMILRTGPEYYFMANLMLSARMYLIRHHKTICGNTGFTAVDRP